MSDLRDHLRAQLVRGLVSRAIVCMRTGEVLDYRTCVVLLDRDGDPAIVLSQSGWAEVVAEGGDAKLATAHGLVVDPATVDAATCDAFSTARQGVCDRPVDSTGACDRQSDHRS